MGKNGSQCGTHSENQGFNEIHKVVELSYNGTFGKRRILVEDNCNPLSLFSNLNLNRGVNKALKQRQSNFPKTLKAYQECMGGLPCSSEA